jgi:hypothetical protein
MGSARKPGVVPEQLTSAAAREVMRDPARVEFVIIGRDGRRATVGFDVHEHTETETEIEINSEIETVSDADLANDPTLPWHAPAAKRHVFTVTQRFRHGPAARHPEGSPDD